jgi:hypothetical protein
LAFGRQHARREHSLRQQQRPAEAERVASEFPDGAQHVSGSEQEARNGTHERKDSTDSAGKEAAQQCLDRVIGEHRDTAHFTIRKGSTMVASCLSEDTLLSPLVNPFPLFALGVTVSLTLGSYGTVRPLRESQQERRKHA